MSQRTHKISVLTIRKKHNGKVPAPSTISPPIHKRTVRISFYHATQLC